jgi:hypothetical protein
LLNVLCFQVVEADLVDEGIESGGFKSKDRLEIEALIILVAIKRILPENIHRAFSPACLSWQRL